MVHASGTGSAADRGCTGRGGWAFCSRLAGARSLATSMLRPTTGTYDNP